MDINHFMELLGDLHAEEIELHREKGKEYTGIDDSTQSFHDIGDANEENPLKVCLILLDKHRIALLRNAQGKISETPEKIRERVRDIRLYMALYLAMVFDENGQSNYVSPRRSLASLDTISIGVLANASSRVREAAEKSGSCLCGDPNCDSILGWGEDTQFDLEEAHQG